MLGKAETGDWEAVAALEKQRRKRVEQCFSRSTSRQDAREVAGIIRDILALNQSIDALAECARGNLGAQIATRVAGKAASSAYQEYAPVPKPQLVTP